MASAPIRQPRGPPSSASAFAAPSAGPPAADLESTLRRNKTVATARGNPAPSSLADNPHRRSYAGVGGFGSSSGVSSMPPPSAIGTPVGGGADATSSSRYRSGSFSNHGSAGVVGDGLKRGSSLRSAASDFPSRPTAEETLVEAEAADEQDGTVSERGTWSKGLNRMSSLQSRRLTTNAGVNPGLFAPPDAPAAQSTAGSMPPPPPRPPRRVYQPSDDQQSGATPASPPPQSRATHSRGHSHNLSLSSLSMIVNNAGAYEPSATSPVPSTPGSVGHGHGPPSSAGVASASVSRTQSLRAHMQQNQATPVEYSNLGRSASMRAPGELAYLRQHGSPPPPHPFSAATPPRPGNGLPAFQYPPGDDSDLIEPSDLKRHQSLTQGYGSSSRVRERLERSQALLSLDQREDLRRRMAASPPAGSVPGSRHSRQLSDIETSPAGGLHRTVWTPVTTGEDGWSAGHGTQHLQDALDALSLREGLGGRPSQSAHPGEEPAWVTNLVGMPGQPSPQQARQGGGGWDDRGGAQYGMNQWGPLQPPLGLFQQQQQQLYAAQAQLKLQAAAAGLGGTVPGFPAMHGYPSQNYLAAPFTPQYPAQQGAPLGVGGAGAGASGGGPLSAQDLDVIELARSKGLNPASYDCRPPVARFFVIKSYTEDDVQKSLKHEIWSSTVLGNKRLDTAFRESNDAGPIYLFFSVNGSRHFCGVAQMLTPVDETKSSTVWAQDKWKGIFKVRWIFVRDVPTAALRHIRLTNTPERKPITNSRDTQELPYDAGCEVLQIFLEHQHKSKTSLLQDFAYYERLSATRTGASGATSPVPPSGQHTPTPGYGNQGNHATPQAASRA